MTADFQNSKHIKAFILGSERARAILSIFLDHGIMQCSPYLVNYSLVKPREAREAMLFPEHLSGAQLSFN